MTAEFEESHLQDLPDDAWMVRPCEMYKEEYKDCKSIKQRFQQYFIYGASQDCSQWKSDYDHCLQWRACKDKESIMTVIESERRRREQRLRSSTYPEVWATRSAPPSDWNSPLPDWMVEEHKQTYLQKKLEEAASPAVAAAPSSQSCVIL